MTLPVSAYIELFSNALPLGAGLARRRSLVRERGVFYAYLAMSLIVELTAFWMALSRIHNLWLLQLYDLAEFVLLMVVFRAWLGSGRLKALMLLAIGLYTLFWIIAKFTIERFSSPADYTPAVSNAIFVIVAIVTIVGLLKADNVIAYKDMRFWIAAGALVYFAGNVPLYVFGSVLSAMRFEEFMPFQKIHWVINIASNVSYTIGFLCLKKA